MNQLASVLQSSGQFTLEFFKILLHLESHMEVWANEYSILIYLIVFAIIYSETGLVIAAFLPGDSLLFLLGTLAGVGLMNIFILIPLIIVAALMGDTTNFFVGQFFKGRIKEKSRWIKLAHIHKTERFFDRHGGKTLIIARFLPIMRTYAPFVAGLSLMKYRSFIGFNIVGAILWSSTIIPAGYFLGQVDFISKLIGPLVAAIVIISVFALAYLLIKSYFNRTQQSDQTG